MIEDLLEVKLLNIFDKLDIKQIKTLKKCLHIFRLIYYFTNFNKYKMKL